jgi:hypothetical protein
MFCQSSTGYYKNSLPHFDIFIFQNVKLQVTLQVSTVIVDTFHHKRMFKIKYIRVLYIFYIKFYMPIQGIHKLLPLRHPYFVFV